jgi:hypothetical protein
MSLRIPSSSRSPDHDPHRTIYYLGYPLGRFAGLKLRQLARQVGVIITTVRIRRTSHHQSIYSVQHSSSSPSVPSMLPACYDCYWVSKAESGQVHLQDQPRAAWLLTPSGTSSSSNSDRKAHVRRRRVQIGQLMSITSKSIRRGVVIQKFTYSSSPYCCFPRHHRANFLFPSWNQSWQRSRIKHLKKN